MSDNAIAITNNANRFFYGWWIVAVSTLAMMVTNGLTIGGIPIFYKPMLGSLIANGAVTPENAPKVIGLAASLTFLVAGFFSPIVGALIGKINLRLLMTVGCVLLGSALLLYSRAAAPTFVYTAHVMFGLALSLAGLLVNTVLVSNWFRRRRGMAMGIVLTGTSLGGALIPLVSAPLITAYGWRTAMISVSLLVWLVLLPAIWLLVRVRPEERGLQPDGDAMASDEVRKSSSGVPEGLTLREALRTPLFWIFALAAACLFYSILSTVQQLALHLQSAQIGLTLAAAGVAQSTLSMSSVGGKFLFGYLSDRLPRPRVLLICCALMFAATLVLLRLTATTTYFFVVPFGLAYGGTFVLLQLLAVECFGLREAGKILGAITVVETIGGAAGLFLTGRLASAAGGNYTTAFYGVIIATAVALLATLALNSGRWSVVSGQQQNRN